MGARGQARDNGGISLKGAAVHTPLSPALSARRRRNDDLQRAGICNGSGVIGRGLGHLTGRHGNHLHGRSGETRNGREGDDVIAGRKPVKIAALVCSDPPSNCQPAPADTAVAGVIVICNPPVGGGLPKAAPRRTLLFCVSAMKASS